VSERGAATAERQAATGERRAGTEEKGLELQRQQAEQQAKQFAQTLGLKLSISELGLLTELVKAENERTLLTGEPADLSAVIQNFLGARDLLRGGAGTPRAEQPAAPAPGGPITPQQQEQAAAQFKVRFPTVESIPEDTFRKAIADKEALKVLVNIYGREAVERRFDTSRTQPNPVPRGAFAPRFGLGAAPARSEPEGQ
jgi:hypothetical protein